MRIAAIDVGSNSIHMMVVEADPMGGQRVMAREKAMVRLARGEAKSGEIGPEAFRAGLEALGQMARLIRDFGCDTIMACGTAALRDANNAQAFVLEAEKLGIPIQVISGEEEARLIHQAVSHAIPFPPEPVALVDIGGGSTELTWVQGGRVAASISLPWGLQRLADAAQTANPPTATDLRQLRKMIRRILKKARKDLPSVLPEPALILGTSGTLEELMKGVPAGQPLTIEQLRDFTLRLWRTDAQQRIERLGIDPKRAEVLHVGAIWALSLMEWLGCPPLRHLPVGLREGMIWEALKHGGAAIPPLADRRRASVEQLAARLDPDPGHSRHVARLADELFTSLQPHFELGDTERQWLAYAARLHDIGFSIAEKGHHKHGEYLVRNAALPGFWPEEVDLLAQVVRFHRGKAPHHAKHEAFRALAPWHRQVVRKLAAILRAADALDRRRRQSVRHLAVEVDDQRLHLILDAAGDVDPEMEAFLDKGALLGTLLDRWIEVTVV
ncbi:MAG: Ppx/GppA family phosphatase [Geothrix sp.]|uniref:Ppx/GppA phosphatase family protein n=1 Tax=Geothrix sp. TaxID=1962974 RepID=UPI00180D1664|nr:Ppx/GppA phosphatase family protein [Geothrix sp.]NWJ39608.1 Ppx/GppA family phosphatase [Geothrix sp.]WIL22369.1 MAG: Ppx/GppA family phosphatase [Geothrix sp.]